MKRTSLYIDTETRDIVRDLAKKHKHSIADMLRCLVELWIATTPVTRAHILSGELWRPERKDPKDLGLNAT